jgi:molybdopterin-guanine dinucleotide biosynthesis protein A
VIVGAGDAPFGGEGVPSLLAALTDDVDGVIGVDPAGHDQLLLGVHRAGALRSALASMGPAETRMREVVERLRIARVPVDARAALDLDTPADLVDAERFLGTGGFDHAQPERRP